LITDSQAITEMSHQPTPDSPSASGSDSDRGSVQSTDAGPPGSPAWHKLETERVIDRLDTGRDGLSGDEAQRRLERHGENEIGRRREVSAWQVVLHQFQSPLIYVLLGALVVTVITSMVTGESRWSDVIVIGMVLIVNGTVGFIQEYRAENAVEALMQMVAPKATVRRDGRRQRVPARTLVPGDVVLLDEGHVVPADLRLIDVKALQINEAALTGESVPVNKSARPMTDAEDDLPPADRQNMTFMGTAVTSGRAEAAVVATGRSTEIGQIARQVEEAGETQTPLQRRIQQLALWITAGILTIAAISFGIGLAIGRDWAQMVTLAVALSVAAIPAGLPIVVTVALAIGVRRMARQHAVIRHLPAVDTLGSCTTIVSDKTGTLTQNRMTVKAIHAGQTRYDVTGETRSPAGEIKHEGETIDFNQHPALRETLLVGVLANDAQVPDEEEREEAEQDERRDADDQGSGDPMEVALLYAGMKAGLDPQQLDKRYPRIDEVPFKTENRFMAVVRDVPEDGGPLTGEGPLVAIKGAPEAVLAMCDTQWDAGGGETDLDADAVRRQNDALAGEGLRVLAFAIDRGDEAVDSIKRDEPRGFTFLGLQGLLDPPRPSAVDAVDDAHRAGIRVMMVTGDHARTGSAIAHEVHIDRPARTAGEGEPAQAPDELPEARTGRDVSDLEDEQLDEALEQTNVFARVKPIQKTRIVDRLKARNHIVAVTGDGVNDAPALKSAHLGAAMGSGTDVAKESSDMVITDDNFASVYRAVERGRTAFRNIRMATFFLLSTGAADVLIILAALGLDWPLPLLPAQILWCNVVTNGIADVALAFEPGERALYRRPPRPPSEGVLDYTLLERLVIVGVWLAVGVLAVFLYQWGFDFGSWTGREENLPLAQTAALTTLVLFQKVHVFNCRSEDVSLFRKSLLANKLLFIGVMTSLVVHIAAVYTPITQKLLGLAPLSWRTWGLATAVASTAIIVNELHKWLRPRFRGQFGGGGV